MVTVSAERLLKIAKSFQSDTVEFAVKNDILIVKSGTSKFDLPSTSPDKFPDFSRATVNDKCCTISTEMLVDMIEKVQFAASKRFDSEPEVCAILFEVQQDSIRIVATNKQKVAFSENSISTQKAINALVPIRALKPLYKISGDIDIHIGTSNIIFKSQDCEIYSQLVAGVFPPYRKFMPKDFYLEAVVDGNFGDAVKNASIVCDDLQRCLLNFTSTHASGQKCCVISAHGTAMDGTTVGDSCIVYPMNFTGEDVAMHFDPAHIYEFFAKISGPVDLKIDKRGAGVFRASGVDYFCVALGK